MIYITADVHAPIQGSNWEQKKAGSELIAAEQYLKILKKHKLASTIFVNGKTLDTQPDAIKTLLQYNIELGGHTYDNYGKMNPIRSYLNRKRYGCVYGSTRYQQKDIEKTKKAFDKLRIPMKSWRTHAFASNDMTFDLLQKQGVTHVSDLFEQQPFKKNGIIHLPLNIPVDGNVIAYGPKQPSNRNPFAGCTKSRIYAQEWFEILKKRVRENEKKNIPSIILIHPITMAALDDFKLFEKIATFLSTYKTGKISEYKL